MKKKLSIVLVLLLILAGCSSSQGTSDVSEADALKIVFDSLSIKEEDVDRLRVQKDQDSLSYKYEVEFIYDNFEYEYEVDQTGEIIKSEKEALSTGGIDKNDMITEDEALALAFEHAEVLERNATRVKVEKDTSKGVPVFEIEFTVDNVEYDYDVSKSGEILKAEKEQK